MSPDPPAAAQPRRWLALARADLLTARSLDESDALQRGIACFHCQQSAEKALKSVLVSHLVAFPWTHNISTLVRLIEATIGAPVPESVSDARKLSDYASATRYPDDIGEVPAAELHAAISTAAAVVDWASGIVDG